MNSVSSNAVAQKFNNVKENFYTLLKAQAITTSYATYSFYDNRKLSDYDYINFYVGLYANDCFYPRGYMRIPSMLFGDINLKQITRVDVPCVGSNNENVSFRYLNDTQIDICLFNTTGWYVKILGEKITS